MDLTFCEWGAYLFAIKQLGVFSFCYLMVRLGKAKLPDGANLLSFFGVAVISGIGFTMSLFIGTLAFESNWDQMGGKVRIGVLFGSLVAAVVGALIIRAGLSRPAEQVEQE